MPESPISRRSLSSTSTLCLALLVSCSGAGGARSQLLLSSRPAPRGQDCVISNREPPALAAFVDSSGLHSSVVDHWRTARSRPGHAVFSIQTDSTGHLRIPPAVIESTLRDTTTAVLANLLAENLQPESITDHLYARIKISVDSVPHFQVGRSESCRPALANRQEVSDLLAAAGAQATASGTAVLRLWVTESGNVTDVRVVRSSGNQNVDGLAMAVASRMEFRSAKNDYAPIAVWVQMPISIYPR